MSTAAPPPRRNDGSPAPDASPVTAGSVVAGVCLLAQFVGLLWVATYAKTAPTLLGFPFFYWYQLLWVLIGATLTVIAYRLVIAQERRRRGRGGS